MEYGLTNQAGRCRWSLVAAIPAVGRGSEAAPVEIDNCQHFKRGSARRLADAKFPGQMNQAVPFREIYGLARRLSLAEDEDQRHTDCEAAFCFLRKERKQNRPPVGIVDRISIL